MNKPIRVEVVYVEGERQQLIALDVAVGTTIKQAIQASDICGYFPTINLQQQKVGIFSKIRQLDEVVLAGDRIEIYRPLIIDPKEARRAKAKQRLNDTKRRSNLSDHS